MNWTRITFFALCPAVIAQAGGFVIDRLLTKFGAGQYGLCAFGIGTVVAIILAVVAILRLRNWETGDGECCERCSGPVSWVHNAGVRWYGKQLSDFHRCWNCGKANGIH